MTEKTSSAKSVKGMYKPATSYTVETVHPIPSVPGIAPRRLVVFGPVPPVQAAKV